MTYVVDPFPPPASGGCEFRLYPNPDEVVFCDRPAGAVLVAPCCQAATRICRECLHQCRYLATWLCLSCNTRTDLTTTPIAFGIRWLA